MSTPDPPAPPRAPTASAGPTCHRHRSATRGTSVCPVVPHRAGVGVLLPARIGRGASGHRARHRLAGRAMPGRRLLRPCGRSLQADGRALVRSATCRPWATRTGKPHDLKPRRPGPRERGWRVRLLSVVRADVAGLRLGNVDLRACRFAGAHNLDRLHIEGAPLLAQVPGWWRTRRATVAEEQRWWAIYHPRPWDGWYRPACRLHRAGRRAAALPA
jgi:hypothetical protein